MYFLKEWFDFLFWRVLPRLYWRIWDKKHITLKRWRKQNEYKAKCFEYEVALAYLIRDLNNKFRKRKIDYYGALKIAEKLCNVQS